MLSDKISGCETRRLWSAVFSVGVSLMLLLVAGADPASTATAANSNNESARLRKDSYARQLMASAEVLAASWSATQLRQAIQNYEKAAQIWTSISDFPNASLAALKAGNVCLVVSELREALKLYKQAALFGEKTGDRIAQGRALSQIGLVHSHMGDNELARKQVDKALVLLKVAESDSTAKNVYGVALSNMAEVTYAEGYFPKALDQFKEAEKYFTDDREGQAKIHLFTGYIYGGLGAAEEAVSEFSQSLKLYRAINNKAGEARALCGFGLFHSAKGDQDQAIQFHRDAFNIFLSIGDRVGEAFALNGIGQAYEQKRQLSVALGNYENALHLFESVGALDFVAGTTVKLAIIHKDLGNHEQALGYYQRCLTLSRAAKKVRNEANALSEIAIVYASQGRPNQAANQHRRAQEFYKAIHDLRGRLTALNNYGDFLLRLGKNQEALNTYREALRLSEEVDDKYIRLTTLYNLARAHQALGNYEAGLDFIEQAIHLSEELRTNVGSLDARASYFSGVKKYYDLCRDILMQLDRVHPGEDYATRAFFISEESRARSLLDSVRESQAELHEGATAELLRHEREVIGTFRLLAEQNYDLSLSNRRDAAELAEVANRMDQLRAEYQEIQAELRAQTKQSSVAQLELKDLRHIQKELQAANAILLEYSLGDERSYLWAIASDSVHSYELPPRKELEGVVREAYESLTARQNLDAGDVDHARKVAAADKRYLEKATQLSQMLLDPVAEQLGTKRLIIVTEGALQYVPFEALPAPGTVPTTPETPSFLIQSNEIVVLPSMSTLMTMRASRIHSASPGRIVAVIADPVFSPSDERVQSGELSSSVAHAASSPIAGETPAALLRAGGPGRLVHASEEADAISKAAPWGTSMVVKGFDATRETAMSPRIGEYQIVHFATHGFLDSEHPELSSLVLSKVDQHGVKMSGLLTLPDIYSLDLSAELIVLSACQTALGKEIKGEGLVGLSYSFMSAGSNSVVASLWKVDDRATFVLMSDFYHSMLSRGVAPVAALRAAKLKMLQDKSLSAPYYWAGFVFQGDYQARINVESNSRLSFGLALLLLVLISSGLIVFRRRRRRSAPTERN